MNDDRYSQNEHALSGLDAWITREPDYDEGLPEREPCCPEFTDMCADENQQGHERCEACGGCVDRDLATRRQRTTDEGGTTNMTTILDTSAFTYVTEAERDDQTGTVSIRMTASAGDSLADGQRAAIEFHQAWQVLVFGSDRAAKVYP